MILLDTDHLTLLKYPDSERGGRLVARLAASGEVVGTTVVTVEEQMRGWLAAVAKERLVRRQVTAYRELATLFEFFAGFHIAPFDDLAAERFDQLRASKVRIGTMDLKIAAVALTQGATVLTANARDYGQVPGLKFENWLS